MILRKLHLHPFAGATDLEVSFAPGLNVVLGLNEAGKSTLRRALRQVLFVPTRLTKREAESEVAPYLPLSGGDTVRVSLEFQVDGEIWRLSKRWASGNSATELVRPDGGLVSDAAAAGEIMAGLLGLSQGTWEHVLFADQGRIGSSLDRLEAGSDLGELNERLRRAVFETDGVSLEKLGESIAKRHETIFGRWDRGMGRPEGNRGLSNRWARGAGTLVNAWYEMESARLALQQAEEYYRRLDELNAALSAISAETGELAAWVSAHEAIARDARERALVEADLAKVDARGRGLKELSQEWPVASSRIRDLEAQAGSIREKMAQLGGEVGRARAWEAAAKMRRQVEDAEKLDALIATAKAELGQLGSADPGKIAELEGLERERDRLRTRLEAALLKVRIASGSALEIETRSGMGRFESRQVAAGGELKFEAGGRVLIRDSEGSWEIEVGSGEIDLDAGEESLRTFEEDFARGLESLQAPDLATARKRAADCRDKARQVALLEGQLATVLGARTLAELRAESEAAGGGSSPPPRSLEEAATELARAEGEAGAVAREISALREKIAAWERDYQSSGNLIDLLADLRGEHKALKQRLEGLLPLPEGFADAEALLREFRSKHEMLEARRAEVHRLQIERAELSGLEPAIEPAEAAEALQHATAAFSRARREGESIERIRHDFEVLRTELDAGTLGPWQNHLAAVLAPLTADRYRALDPGLGSAERGDEVRIPFAALSAGARATLGLAVRLSMARWFLEGRGGFLLLDDPFVDLDPDRLAAAAAIVRRFSEEKQVLFFTCHPGHAGQLGGASVRL